MLRSFERVNLTNMKREWMGNVRKIDHCSCYQFFRVLVPVVVVGWIYRSCRCRWLFVYEKEATAISCVSRMWKRADVCMNWWYSSVCSSTVWLLTHDGSRDLRLLDPFHIIYLKTQRSTFAPSVIRLAIAKDDSLDSLELFLDFFDSFDQNFN